MSEQVLNLGADATVEKSFVSRATDPVVSNVGTPTDFAAQFPNPLDQSELLQLCEEVNLLRNIPEMFTGLKTYTWREMTSLALTSGTSYIGFADGYCPEEYTHDGSNKSIDLKNIGAKKSLTLSDIMHSAASIAAGYGINNLVGGANGSSNMPGGLDNTLFTQARIADLKAKEMQLASVGIMNGWDRLLAVGNDSTNALEFDGIESIVITGSGAHVNSALSASGTFSAAEFDRFLSEGCAKPTHIFGHPAAIQEMLSAYFQLGFQGSQAIQYTNGANLVPGFNFAGAVNTGIGQLPVIADVNFTRTDDSNGKFTSTLFPLRMSNNGEQLVTRITQIPLAFKDLAPGCTAISFQVWAKTALLIKNLCMQSAYKSHFTGNVVSTCTRVSF
jgi:hypothetical protein